MQFSSFLGNINLDNVFLITNIISSRPHQRERLIDQEKVQVVLHLFPQNLNQSELLPQPKNEDKALLMKMIQERKDIHVIIMKLI